MLNRKLLTNQFKISLVKYNHHGINKINFINRTNSASYNNANTYNSSYKSNYYQSRSYSSSSPPPSKSKFSKLLIPLTLIGCFTLYSLYDYKPMRTILRLSRSVGTLLFTGIYLRYNWWYLDYIKLESTNPTEYKLRLKKINQFVADLMLDLFQNNKGLYVKVGQYLATLTYILPKQYPETFKCLQNDSPKIDFSEIQKVLYEEYGRLPEELLLNPVPIASASLAQVHEGYIHGEKIALKVQFPYLKDDFKIDLTVLGLVFWGVKHFFPEYDLAWMHTEIADNITKELDFINEAKNSEITRKNLSNIPHVYVPEVKWKYTTKRVLVMEFIKGIKINELQQLKDSGFSLAEICETTLTAMASMIFEHGFVHCDPHPGNLFVRNDPKTGKYQVVILDHGLYRKMEPETRLNYCKFWHSLIMRDDDASKYYAAQLGVKTNWELLAMMVLLRPVIGNMVGFANPVRKSDVICVAKKIKESKKDWPKTLQEMPRELLLVLRNQNYVRALIHEMDYPVNRFRIMARTAVKGIYRDMEENINGSFFNKLTKRIEYYFEITKFEINLVYADLLNAMFEYYLLIFNRSVIESLKNDRFHPVK